MLKIKDNVDLKELEKFGLKPKYDEDTGEIIAYESVKCIFGSVSDIRLIFMRKQKGKKRLRFRKNTRNEFLFNEHYFYVGGGIDSYSRYCDFDTLYDLIKADMVEKVEE